MPVAALMPVATPVLIVTYVFTVMSMPIAALTPTLILITTFTPTPIAVFTPTPIPIATPTLIAVLTPIAIAMLTLIIVTTALKSGANAASAVLNRLKRRKATRKIKRVK